MLVGVGGQGVILAGEILCDILIRQGFSVKKSEIHGLAQRGGSVCSHVRFGKIVYSPVIPEGECDYLLSFDNREQKNGEKYLKPNGSICRLEKKEIATLKNPQTLNIALIARFLYVFSDPKNSECPFYFSIYREEIARFIKSRVPRKWLEDNLDAIAAGYA